MVAPHVKLGPVQEWMDAHVVTCGDLDRIVSPKFGRLIPNVPFAGDRSRTKDALFGASRLFVAPNSDKDASIALALEKPLQSLRLARRGSGSRRKVPLDIRLRGTQLDAQVEVPFARDLIAKI